jgi:eukaryotic-like serine/threonine-protein kinase
VIDIGTVLNERFLLEKELGRGGMGAVYSAIDQLLERSVAIKVLKEQSGEDVRKRLRLEAQIAARLLHENVVRVYDFGQTEAAYFLVMEEVNGTSYSKRWRHVALADRLQILADVAEALDYAHHQGVVHRDVKPGNVLLTAADVPKLSDFGLSMIAERGENAGVIRGTPHYMSPEQTRPVKLDYRTDLYSLGVMIYESSTGSVPFTGSSVSIMSQHYSVEPEQPRVRNPAISLELEALTLALLAKKPESRPGSGGLVAQALRVEIDRLRGRGANAGTSQGIEPGSSAVGTSELAAPPPAQPPGSPAMAPPAVVGASAVAPSAAGTTAEQANNAPAPSAATALAVAGDLVHGSPAQLAGAMVAATGGFTALIGSPLARRMIEVVLAEPVMFTADERYLYGHYLAYLLSGSRRRGLFLRRPLEPKNADRGRLLLGLAYALLAGGTDEAIGEAAALLDKRIEVRPLLSPVVVAKYLQFRSTPAKRKLFRQTRRAIGEASNYARKRMLDTKGTLNPGLMPSRLEDLGLLAPARTEVDDVLVERWNRVTEVWRDRVEFRTAVLRYATVDAHRDPASTGLWPEVVYPLIERARWHRRVRTRTEAIWDYLSGRLHMPAAGVGLDRALDYAVPAPLVAELDESLALFDENPRLDEENADPFAHDAPEETDRLTGVLSGGRVSLVELAAESAPPERAKGVLPLVDVDPLRFSQGELHQLWKEALAALQSQVPARPGARPAGHRPVPVGPYRLVVIPSIRGRAAGQIAIQGMPNKQIELTTPTIRTKGSSSKRLVAIWVYRDNSLVIAHIDFVGSTRYVFWHAPRSHQLNFEDPAELNHELYGLGMEVPDQVDRALTRSFKPRSTV